MSYPLLQFVASPDTGATVRFDFNTGTTGVDGSTEVLQDGFSLGSPTLQGDPDGIGSEYGFRELSIPLRINGTTTSAPVKFATLARELGRQTNWLRFQATATSSPYWFKTYRSAPEPLDWEQFRNLPAATVAKCYVDLKLDADPFAVGAELTLASGAVINNNPAAGTNPMRLTLPAVVGDAPAPVKVRASQIHGGGAGQRVLLSVTEVAPTFIQVGTSDGMTAGTDTGAAVANAAFSGGSYRPVTFATNAALTARLSFTTPSVPVGLYRFMVRIVRSDTASTFGLKLSTEFTAGQVSNFSRSVTSTVDYAQWVDLGIFSIPDGAFATRTNAGNAVAACSLQASRLTGAGEMRVDAFAMIPVLVSGSEASQTLFSVVNLTVSGNPYVMEWDGAEESFQFFDSGVLYAAPPTVNVGAYPVVRPDAAGNFLVVVPHTDATAPLYVPTVNNGDGITGTTTVTVTYRPRWLWLAAS